LYFILELCNFKGSSTVTAVNQTINGTDGMSTSAEVVNDEAEILEVSENGFLSYLLNDTLEHTSE
jgi:hypothetical protein